MVKPRRSKSYQPNQLGILQNIQQFEKCCNVRKEENKKERIECTGKLYRISLGVLPFYKELHKIFIDDHPQVTIVV